MTTIRRNTKAARAAFQNATRCNVHCLENYFHAEETSIEWALKAHEAGSKLRSHGNGRFSVRVHGNLWYEFWTVCPACIVEEKLARRYQVSDEDKNRAAMWGCTCSAESAADAQIFMDGMTR